MPVRLRSLLLSLAGALAGACGSGGGSAPPPTTTPEIVGITPTVVWRDATTTLSVTGSETGWSPLAPPSVEGGPGVKAETVTVESPTSLRVDLRVAYDASPGPRPLVVGSGSAACETPPVEVKAPVVASWLSQPFVRASVLVGVAQARRPGESAIGPVAALASDGSLLPMYFDDPTAFAVVVPEDAPLGPFDLWVPCAGPAGPSTVRVPGGTIQPRSAVFTAFPMQVSMPTVDGTALHRYAAETACYLEFPMTSSDPTLPLHFLYAHESPFAPPVVGRWPVIYGVEEPGPRAVALPGETFDVLVFTGHTAYGIGVVEAPAPVVAEAEPNDKSSEAQPLALPAIVAPATIGEATDDDWYRVEVGAADLGKVLRVVASPGPAFTLAAYRWDGAMLGGGSTDGQGSGFDLTTGPLALEGPVYLWLSSTATPERPDAASAYRLFVRFESP